MLGITKVDESIIHRNQRLKRAVHTDRDYIIHLKKLNPVTWLLIFRAESAIEI